MLQRGMTKSLDAVSKLSDTELLTEVRVAAAREREATAQLIALLAVAVAVMIVVMIFAQLNPVSRAQPQLQVAPAEP